MAENMTTPLRDPQLPRHVDSFFMQLWKASVLVIGLRIVLWGGPSPLLLIWLMRIVMLLLASALLAIGASLIELAWRMLRALRRASPSAGSAVLAMRAWLRRSWPIALAIDCALAAAIIPLALILAVEDRLDWGGVAWLLLLGLVRELLPGLAKRAGAGAAPAPAQRRRS